MLIRAVWWACSSQLWWLRNNDVIIMAQVAGNSSVSSITCSASQQGKHYATHYWCFTREFHTQRTSYVEAVFKPWRHHVFWWSKTFCFTTVFWFYSEIIWRCGICHWTARSWCYSLARDAQPLIPQQHMFSLLSCMLNLTVLFIWVNMIISFIENSSFIQWKSCG